MNDNPLDLRVVAYQTLRTLGFEPDFDGSVRREAEQLRSSASELERSVDARDLRGLPWSSIDNRESRDLDQIEMAEARGDGAILVRVGVADVAAFVSRGSAIDRHAAANTTSVYAGVDVFPMLPAALSTDLTSLNEGLERLAVVLEYVVAKDGSLSCEDVYRARTKNQAQLVYEDVGAWLEGHAGPPAKLGQSRVLLEQLRLQDEAALRLRSRRHAQGALDLETIEARAVAEEGRVVDVTVVQKSRASHMIEDFMIAANGVMARALDRLGVSSIRRVVKSPERWSRLVTLANSRGGTLPAEPSNVALSAFLDAEKVRDPAGFGELSLTVVKLMGPGEYVLERARETHTGHFGLAVQDYTHSTAPNRRFSDLVTQRMLENALAGKQPAYANDELADIAARCTAKEDDARKVERTLRKVVAAQLLSSRIGQHFPAIVTGASPKGTYVRLLHPAAEGRVVRGEAGLDVGDRVTVRLLATEPRKGFIDFARV